MAAAGKEALVAGLALDALLERFDGDRALLVDIATIFLEDYPARLAAVEAAIARGDLAALQAAAHSLKGSAGTFGSEAAVQAALKLELLGYQGDLAGADTALAELKKAMTELTAKLAVLTVELA